MQQLEIAAIAALVIGIIVVVTSARARRSGGIDHTSTRLVVGSVVGLIGAAVVLAPRLDVVPDTWQTTSESILIGAITLVVILVSVYRKIR